MKTFSVATRAKNAFVDITSQVALAVEESGVLDGTATVFVAHTTAGITINENADPDIKSDMLAQLSHMVPENGPYDHSEGNSAGHIKASLMGFSTTLIVTGARPVLGTWQGIYLCEFDGPRTRTVHVQVCKCR